MKLNENWNKKLSITVGLLAFAAFIIQGLGETWGFGEVGKQVVATVLLFIAGINIYFLGSTAQKGIEETKNETTTTKRK